jgi:cbb3-type cytochrome oxidase cytochrome c subunit
VDDLNKSGANAEPDKEIIALIAYLQKLGKSEPVLKNAQASVTK